MIDVESRGQRFGRLVDESLEGVAVPGYEVVRGGFLLLGGLALLAGRGRFCCSAFVLDRIFGCLTDHAAALVEALAARAPRDLLELAHAQDPDLFAVELEELREEHRADRDVDADAERVRPADHLEQALLRELLDEQPVFREQARVVQTDAVSEKALHVLAVRGVEFETRERGVDLAALFSRRDPRARQALRLLGALALGEVHDVDRRLLAIEQRFDGLVQGRLAILEVERHGARFRVDARDLAPALCAQLFFDRRGVSERRGHQQKDGPRQQQQRDLPRDTAVAVSVVVELVEHHVADRSPRALAQRHVREHFGRAADQRCAVVDARIAGQHADALGAEQLAELEELLARERLDGAGVERARALAERLEVQRERDERSCPSPSAYSARRGAPP